MKRLLACLLLLTGLCCPLAAEPILKGYADFATYQQRVKQLAEHPLAEVSSLAKTPGGREIYLITLGTKPTKEKPALLIVGNVAGPHLLGAELAEGLAAKILKDSNQEEALKSLLKKYTLYVIPRPCPDAEVSFFKKPYRERIGNATSTDEDRDARIDEDPQEDLNQDGFFTQMRVKDPAGEYILHPDDERILIKADPQQGERGSYSLYTEGTDNDEDEQFNEDGPGGVAFNRNFTFEYPYFQPHAGEHQISEPETRAVADFAFDHPNIVAVFTFSPLDNLFHPWKVNKQAENKRIKTTLLSKDEPYVKYFAEKYRELHGGKDAPNSPEGKGAFSEWAYFHYGRWSFAAQAWWVPKAKPPEKQKEKDDEDEETKAEQDKPSNEKRGAEELNALRWFEQQDREAFVEWQEIEHPDFPDQTVEVGGFHPFVRLNPTKQEFEPLIEKHTKAVVELTQLFPQLAFGKTEVKTLGNGLYEITVIVRNEGYLPTMSEMGRISKQVYPLQLSIQLPDGAKLVTGHTRTAIGVLAGKGGQAKHTWLLSIPKQPKQPLKVQVHSPSVGKATTQVTLPE